MPIAALVALTASFSPRRTPVGGYWAKTCRRYRLVVRVRAQGALPTCVPPRILEP